MKIGFPKPRMREEKRIALLPRDITRFVEDPTQLYFESGYGMDYGYNDMHYTLTRANVVYARKAYSQEVVCQPKFSLNDFQYMDEDKKGQVAFGWLHLTKRGKMTRELKKREATAIAWELMMKDGEKVFQGNGKLTGRIGVLHSIAYAGKLPENCRVAVIGRGRVGKGALEQLKKLKVREITTYHTNNYQILRNNIGCYDVIVNCACGDDEILNKRDLGNMKPGALLVDIGGSCIWGGYKPMSIYAPVKLINDGRNLVYCVNHVPTLAYKKATLFNSRDVAPYINMLVKNEMDDILKSAVVINRGKPVVELK